MQNRGQLILGGGLLLIGLLLLVGNLFNINLWVFCWPALLIGLGVYLILRPQILGPGTRANIRPLGGVRRYGDWEVRNEEIWMFVGDIRLDFTRAAVPPGESRIRIYGFVGDVELLTSPDVGMAISAIGFFTDAALWGEKQESFLAPVNFQTPNYAASERRIFVETFFFVSDLDAGQV